MTLLRLPAALRDAFKEPLGPVYTDPERLLSEAGDPVVAVGDVVTAHLRRAGRPPDVAVVDGRTERGAVDADVRRAVEAAADDLDRVEVTNEPATLSAELLDALRTAVDDGRTVLVVDGEEDLATLPALLVVPEGGSVVYGQPGEGMVHVAVTPETRRRARDLFGRLDGDVEEALSILGVEG